MTYEMYRYVFLGAAIASGVSLMVAILLFFTLRIPKVISDLTGRTARKAIENIRMQNERSGDKSYQSSAVNLERGKLTDKISQSGRLVPQNATPFGTGVITEKISTQQLPPEEPIGETAVLTASEETSVLGPGVGETVPLSPAEQLYRQEFAVEYEITFIHTTEVIA